MGGYAAGAEASVLVQEGMKVHVVALDDLPESRHDYMRFYSRPIEDLDLAWDEFHARQAVEAFTTPVEGGRPRVPSLATLGVGGVDPAALSLVFDLAISAYVRSLKPPPPGGRRPQGGPPAG